MGTVVGSTDTLPACLREVQWESTNGDNIVCVSLKEIEHVGRYFRALKTRRMMAVLPHTIKGPNTTHDRRSILGGGRISTKREVVRAPFPFRNERILDPGLFHRFNQRCM